MKVRVPVPMQTLVKSRKETQKRSISDYRF
jgi:hypothetical protein